MLPLFYKGIFFLQGNIFSGMYEEDPDVRMAF